MLKLDTAATDRADLAEASPGGTRLLVCRGEEMPS